MQKEVTEVTSLFTFLSFSSKSVFFTKPEISFLFAKFAWANLSVKCFAVNLLNSGVVIYLPWSLPVIFFLVSLIFVL